MLLNPTIYNQAVIDSWTRFSHYFKNSSSEYSNLKAIIHLNSIIAAFAFSESNAMPSFCLTSVETLSMSGWFRLSSLVANYLGQLLNYAMYRHLMISLNYGLLLIQCHQKA